MNPIHGRARAAAGILFLMGAAAAGQTPGLESVRITITSRSTPGKETARQGPWGRVRVLESHAVHLFRFQRMDTSLPDRLAVEWVIAVEAGTDGTRTAADAGVRTVEMPFARTVDLTTTPVVLLSRERERRWDLSVSDRIAGVAIRIRTPDGTLVAERYQPRTIEPFVDEWITDWERQQAPRDRPRDRPRPPPRSPASDGGAERPGDP